jgi:hypothetical protein
MIEFGYYYYDSPTVVVGPLSEKTVKEKADNDLAIQVVYREDSEQPWYVFDYISKAENA